MVNNKERLYWSLQLGGWTFYAIVQIVASVLNSASSVVSTQRVLFLLYEALFCFLVTHVFRIFILKARWLNLSLPRLIPKVIVTVFALGAVMYLLRIPVSIPLGLYKKDLALDLFNFLGLSVVYAIIFFLWAALYFTYNYFERYNKSLKYEAYAREIELNNLKSQINPHFIFNALNSIRALVDEDPQKSKKAINQLSNILRSSLTIEKRGLTKFEDEMVMVKDYLGLESIRFEERLITEFDIAPGSNDFLVPPLMIQTLVENGVKHGISKLTQGGVVQVTTKIVDNALKIRIRNSGHYVNGKGKHSGLGLTNTIQRLKLLYGDKAYFKITNEINDFVVTEISIPNINTPTR
jgi:two-component system, LytTR family, sensor kinase